MKSPTALNRIADLKALKSAWRGISKRNKLSHGVDNVTIKKFSSNLEGNLKSIRHDLLTGNYNFSPLRPSEITKVGSSKPRPIQIPVIRDLAVLRS
jgi:RNA-directed DNA polymerase